MRKIALIFQLLSILSLALAHEDKIEKIYINPNQTITIPKIADKKLQEFSFSVKNAKIKPFYIAKYETTLHQYIQYLKANKLQLDREIDDDALHEPVTDVDYHRALQVCKFYGGRLPTELEWVVSASIKVASSKCYEDMPYGSFTPYPTRDYPLQEHDKEIECMMQDDDEIEPELIGSELLDVSDSYENINGTYGMLGNVWEWVESKKIYFHQPYETIKGGSFANFQQKKIFDSRVSNFLNPNSKRKNVGFRCAWDTQKRQKEIKK